MWAVLACFGISWQLQRKTSICNCLICTHLTWWSRAFRGWAAGQDGTWTAMTRPHKERSREVQEGHSRRWRLKTWGWACRFWRRAIFRVFRHTFCIWWNFIHIKGKIKCGPLHFVPVHLYIMLNYGTLRIISDRTASTNVYSEEVMVVDGCQQEM